MNGSEKRFQWSVPSWKLRRAQTTQEGHRPPEQNLLTGLITRPKLWEINQINEVWWSERATFTPPRKCIAHLKINVS